MINRQIEAREERKYKAIINRWYSIKDVQVKMEGRPEWIFHQRLKHGKEECRFISHNPEGGAKVEWTKGWIYSWECDYTSNNVPYDKLEPKSCWVGQPERVRKLRGMGSSSPEKLTWDKLRGEQ